MFLFLIGLEMRPSRLWGLRHQILGLGLSQVATCSLLLTVIGLSFGLTAAQAFVAAAGFVLTSTAVVMQMLSERGDIASIAGQRVVSVLLLEDLMIVPLLALVAFLAPIAPESGSSDGIHWVGIGTALVSICGLIIAGRYLLNPLFGLLANTGAREVMTAAALLVVLGSAYAMQLGGLSMAMGAFVAGVLLSESSYRHQLEVDIEPFRGVLLGLFFLAVGMSLDLGIVVASWKTVALYVAAYMATKAVAIYLVARVFRSSHREALERALSMAQGGEFAFVLYAAAAASGIIDTQQHALLTAVVVLSMAVTPLTVAAFKAASGLHNASIEGYPTPAGETGAALIIGFGRVGQIASQFLLERGFDISIIDTDVEMIDVAREFDFKVYYGDGTRLDILRASGASQADVALVCIDNADGSTRITSLLKSEFPLLPVLVRSVDRVHSLALVKAGADYQVRETFESAMVLGCRALESLGVGVDEIDAICTRIRERDQCRLDLQVLGGLNAGRELFSGKPGRDPE